jgi:hypothetical protein
MILMHIHSGLSYFFPKGIDAPRDEGWALNMEQCDRGQYVWPGPNHVDGGICLPRVVFSHGQLMALIRASTEKKRITPGQPVLRIWYYDTRASGLDRKIVA